ncbi:MAG: amidohydrolase family protein [Thermodesulfobacteriota bacterium]
MKIDIFTHVMLPRYKERLYKHAHKFATEKAVQDRRPVLTDTAARLRKLEPYPDMAQVLSTTMPPVEEVVGPAEAAELARICNDEMAELTAKHPDRYIAAIANVPLNNMDIALKETERAVQELGFKGIQIHTRVLGKPLSSEELMPLYELMVKFDLPIWIHPMRSSNQPDYPAESVSYNQLFSIFGWPYDTTAAMVRLVFAGIFERFPAIKFITHHCGGMVPYFADRLVVHYNNGLERLGAPHFPGLTKHPVDYLRMFYNDTALNGNPSALRCGLEFFGENHLLFGTDMPYDIENGGVSIRETIRAVEAMGVSESVRSKIYEGNARRLLHL